MICPIVASHFLFWVEIRAQWLHLPMYHNFFLIIVRSAFLWRLLCWSTKVEFTRCRVWNQWLIIKIFPEICGGVTVDSILECPPLSAPGTWAIMKEIAYDMIMRWKCKFCPWVQTQSKFFLCHNLSRVYVTVTDASVTMFIFWKKSEFVHYSLYCWLDTVYWTCM